MDGRRRREAKKGLAEESVRPFSDRLNPGDDLPSHAVSHAVLSALEGLTSVFGMGTGVTPPLQPPETLLLVPSGRNLLATLGLPEFLDVARNSRSSLTTD